MTENRSRPRPADFAWNDPEPVQKEPTGPALGNPPVIPYDPADFQWLKRERLVERRSSVGEKIADFLDKLADRAREWR